MDPSASHSSHPSPDTRAGLVEALRVLEKDPEAHPQAKQRLQGWLEQVEESDQEPHLTLEELRSLAEEPGKQPLPKHLRRCRMCMDLFQVLRSEKQSRTVDSPSRSTSSSESSTPSSLSRKVRKRHLANVAALLVILLLLIKAYQPPTLIIESGQLQHEGEAVASTTVPGRQNLEALQETQLSLLDGSRITLEPGSTFRVGTHLNLTRYFELQSGELRGAIAGDSSKLFLYCGPIRIHPGTSTYTLNIQNQTLTLEILQGEIDVETPETRRTLKAGDLQTWPYGPDN